MRERLSNVVEAARPYVERMATDSEVREHVRSAYDSAQRIYDELIGGRGTTAAALRMAKSKDLQDDLRRAIAELREAGRHVQGKRSHAGRNTSLLLTGIALGVLFNPATGPDTRRWLKERLLGSEELLAYEGDRSPVD